MSRCTLRAFGASLVVLAACSMRTGQTSAPPLEPSVGRWKTWVLSSPSEVEVPPPPKQGSAAASADLAEVRRAVEGRTPQIEEQARFWSDYPAVQPWIKLGLDLVVEQGVRNPPRAARGYALTSVAMYDAAVSASLWKYVYGRPAPDDVDRVVPVWQEPSYPSEHAALAGAASRVLAYVYPELPADFFDQLAEEAATSRVAAGANYPSDVAAGLKLGRAVADAVIARARTDGYGREWQAEVPPGNGFWKPPPGSAAPPLAPLAGTWRTWVLRSGDQLRPPPPPAYGSPAFVAEATNVMQIGDNLSDDEERIAKYWSAGAETSLPPGMWNELALERVRAEHLSIPHMARVFALLNIAEADAAIAAWDCKYAYWSPRPVNVIRDLAMDPAWSPYLPTPPFPAYVSGHSTFSAAASEVLAYLFPQEASEFRTMAEEAGMSRVYGGIHYPADNIHGLDLGREIGRLVVDRAKRDGASAPRA
ncbi:MAG: phosphatase PAP2 family protein [Actinomycetota bacterium]|nr:phosphatase PAP2 family protein [Actinomycetota bacterium]